MRLKMAGKKRPRIKKGKERPREKEKSKMIPSPVVALWLAKKRNKSSAESRQKAKIFHLTWRRTAGYLT